jgi:hypothetical protein
MPIWIATWWWLAAELRLAGTSVAALERLDGYVVWAADGEPDSPGIDDLHGALRRWFGNPRR